MVAFEQITSIFNRQKDISISLYADDAFIFTKKKKISILSRKLSLKFWKSWSNGVLYPGLHSPLKNARSYIYVVSTIVTFPKLFSGTKV